jgi:hypothetical protein
MARTQEEDWKMKERIAHKMIYLGAGAGFILFVMYGILPGSFLGGMAGLGLAGTIFGSPVEPGITSRILVALSILAGVMVSGLIFVTVASTVGYMVGNLIDSAGGARKSMVPVESRK